MGTKWVGDTCLWSAQRSLCPGSISGCSRTDFIFMRHVFSNLNSLKNPLHAGMVKMRSLPGLPVSLLFSMPPLCFCRTVRPERNVILGSKSLVGCQCPLGSLRKSKTGNFTGWSIGRSLVVRVDQPTLCLSLQEPPKILTCVQMETFSCACFSLCPVSAFGRPGRISLPPLLLMHSPGNWQKHSSPWENRLPGLLVTTVFSDLISSRTRNMLVTSTKTSTQSSAS